MPTTPLPGVPWTSDDVDDMTADIEARNDAAEAEAGGGGQTEAEVDAAIAAAVAALVDSSPSALDTLNELAAALGDDANFATTVTNALATKIAKSTLDANSILIATTDDTPIPLPVAASRIVGRKATGDIDDLTPAEVLAILQATLDAVYVAASNGGREVIQTHGNTGATETIDVANGNVHIVTQDQACTYTFTNPASSTTACSFTLILTAVTGAATWPASVNWPDATAPTLSGRCVLTFVTLNGGTDWDGFLAGAALA